MIGLVIAFIRGSAVARWIGIVLAALAVLKGRDMLRDRETRKDAQADAMRDAAKRVDKGRKAVTDSRDGRSPDERLRDNDDRW